MRWLNRLVAVIVLGTVLASGLGTAWAGAPASRTAVPNTGSGLQIAVSGTASAPILVLTNTASAPCQVADTSLGTTVFDRVSQQGHSILPVSADATFDDSVDRYLATRMRTLASGGSVRIPLRVVAFGASGRALETVAWSQTTASLASLFPIAAGQPIQVSVSYAAPIVSGGAVPACAPAEGTAPTALTLPATASTRASRSTWIAIGAGALLAVLLIGLLILLLRRRKAAATARVVVILALLAASLVHAGTSAPQASATITVDGGLASAFGPCKALFNGPGGDPAKILPTLNGAGDSVQIIDANGDQTHEISAGHGAQIIFWNINDHHAYAGTGGNADPCTALYHEMYHAAEDATGGQDHTPCWYAGPGGKLVDSGLPVNEVKATVAQNVLRPKVGQPERSHYGELPLPPGPCLPPPPKPAKPANCSGQGCGDTNGDPHLRTFDGARYDFQAAGEFVTVRDPRGGFEVQSRQQPFAGSSTVAVTTAAALDVAGDRVEVRAGQQGLALVVDGVPQSSTTQVLTHGGTLATDTGASGETMTVTWPDTSVATISQIGPWGLHLSVQPDASHAGHLEGLLGNLNGDPADDVRPAGGPPIAAPTFATLYPGFADSWRVAAAASLFTYSPGTSTDTYTDRSFPHAATNLSQVSNLAQATKLCSDAGITDPATLQDCELDVGLTGRPDFATADAASQAQQVVGGSGIDGPPTTVSITASGSTARVPFTATAGQKVFVDVPSSTLPDECGVIELDAPDGTRLANGCVLGGTGFIDGTVLPTTGQYSVVVHSTRADSTGTITVRVIGDTDQSGTIAADGPPVTAVIDRPGAVSRFTFAAQPGTKVFLDAPTSTLADRCGVLLLVAPNGKVLSEGCTIAGNGFIDGTVLESGGTYTIVVDPPDRLTGQAALRLIVDHDQSGTISIGGPPVSATVAQPGAVARFGFSVTAGQKVSLQVSAATTPDECGQVTITSPNGDATAATCVIGGTGTIPPTLLTASGQYTVVVDPGDRRTGSMVLRLLPAS